MSAAGPNAAVGTNGCVYPSTVPTLFNQLDAAHTSWKGYAQDLGNPDVSGPAHDAGTQFCGAPYASPGAAGATAQPNPGGANATDQYVPKHFPFPWYSWLRTMEDVFGVAKASPGLDRKGHIGYAAQPGLEPFGRDVFNNTSGSASWLPTPALPVGRVVQASAAQPWLAVEGDTVRVHLAAGQVMATAVGPRVLEEGKFPVPATSECTFMVTFTAASGSVALNPAAFTTLDEEGHLHRLSVSVKGGGTVPASVTSGHTVTLLMSATLPAGSGSLRWTPSGTQPIVSWDFDVEID